MYSSSAVFSQMHIFIIIVVPVMSSCNRNVSLIAAMHMRVSRLDIKLTELGIYYAPVLGIR